jgi:hypothetical protein
MLRPKKYLVVLESSHRLQSGQAASVLAGLRRVSLGPVELALRTPDNRMLGVVACSPKSASTLTQAAREAMPDGGGDVLVLELGRSAAAAGGSTLHRAAARLLAE